jgi:hypothetical protein
MSEPDMAAPLSNNAITETLQRPDQAISGYISRKFHAAWTGINSSRT